jgi:EF hand
MNQPGSTIIGKQRKIVLCSRIFTALLVFGTMAGTALPQKVDRIVPQPQRTVALLVEEVKQLLVLMDSNGNGKISKKEFMSLMEAQFDRLDKDKSGQLDVKALMLPQVRANKPLAGK